MMNDELLKNFSISCNHAQGTFFSYELALRKYCEYFGMSLKELLYEAEEDENNGVKWKHSKLKAKLVEYRHYMYQHYAPGTVRNWHYLRLMKKAFKSLLQFISRICQIRQ